MLKEFILTVSLTGVLAAANPSTADEPGDLGLQARTPERAFLQPVELKLVVRSDRLLPQFCAKSSRTTCPPIVSGGGIPGGAWTPGDFGYDYRNVRVSFYVQEISNEIVANGGADVASSGLVRWLTTGSTADVENGGPYHWTLPGPGQTYSEFGPHGSPSGLLIYDALVFNACGSFTSFPVDHEATATEAGATIGSFMGTDNSTIDSTGYYNLSYTIRAEDSSGGVSDFRIVGKVAAICSGQNSL